MKTLLLREDSRDKVFKQKFGQVVTLPEEYNADSSLFDDIQPLGDVKCVCYSTCDIAEDQQKREFDILDLWQRIPSNQFGSDPRDVLKEAVSNGLLPKGQTERVKDWKSFWDTKGGLRDVFDNVRSGLYMSQSPVMCATYWHAEWLNVPAFGVMPVGKTQLNGHAWVAEGWKMVNGEPVLIVEAWVGRKMYMPRNVFNEAMKPYGMQSWVLSTSEIDQKRQKTILEAIRDTLVNVVLIMKQLLWLKQADSVVPKEPVKDTYTEVKEAVMEKKDRLDELCYAIRDYEGKPGDLNYKNNNPGNLRSVQGPFLKFKTMEAGMNALRDYIRRVVTGKHRAYKSDCTLLDFFKVYAPSSDNNYPDKYAKYIASRLKVDISTRVKDLVVV